MENQYDSTGILVFTGFFWLFYIVFIVAFLVGLWKTFEKAGQPGWAAIIPFYNIYILLKITNHPGWWLIFFFVPLVNIVIAIIVYLDLAKAFGKSVLFGIFGLLIFSPIGFMVLGFGKDVFKGKMESQVPPPSTPVSTS